jgi:hypothetical protein
MGVPRLRRLAALVLALLAIAPGAVRAEDASPDDIAQVQGELDALSAELDALDADDARVAELRDRAALLREDLIYLKVSMRRHAESGAGGSGVSRGELVDLRESVSELRRDVARAFGDPEELRVPEGTAFEVRLDSPLSSRTARAEDRVDATLVQAVRVDGEIAIPAGTSVRGLVRAAEPAQRPSRAGRLELSFDAVYLEDGRVDMRARMVEFQEGSGAGRKAGIGAAVGAIVGGILGGKDGAIAGILVGGGGAVVASKGEDVELPTGTVVTLRLDRPLRVPAR